MKAKLLPLFLKYEHDSKKVLLALGRVKELKSVKRELEVNTLFLSKNVSLSQRLWHIMHETNIGGICMCGASTTFNDFKNGYRKYCSSKCANNTLEIKQKIKQTLIKKYGVKHHLLLPEFLEKRKQTCLKKYGVPNINQVKNTQIKRKNTWIKKYGVAHPHSSALIRDKFKHTCVKKYGVENPSQNKDIQEKIKKTRLKVMYNNLFSSHKFTNLIKPVFCLEDYQGTENFKYKFQCLKCNNIFEDHLDNNRIPRCYNCYPTDTYSSKYENEIEAWLEALEINRIQRNIRSIISPLELDIYLPDYNLAIEFNGLWSHSEIAGNKDRNYHLNKTNLCKEKGIELIHIFEDEWLNKQAIVKSIIKNKLGLIDNKVYARECEIKEVGKEALLFLMNNHLQEPITTKHTYGLYYKNELVYLISLSKPRFNKNYGHELIRSCGKIDTTIIGGFNKLINYAKKELNITSLISYVDKRYFNGKGYKDWNLLNETKPNYFYMKDYQSRESRIKYQKHKIIEKEDDKLLTEWELMQLKGYDRIWDCGNLAYRTGKLA